MKRIATLALVALLTAGIFHSYPAEACACGGYAPQTPEHQAMLYSAEMVRYINDMDDARRWELARAGLLPPPPPGYEYIEDDWSVRYTGHNGA